MRNPEPDLQNLPEVKVLERAPYSTLLQVDTWNWYLEEELERNETDHWKDARAMIAFAIYMDEQRAKRDEAEEQEDKEE